jgi:hypothetical protein
MRYYLDTEINDFDGDLICWRWCERMARASTAS